MLTLGSANGQTAGVAGSPIESDAAVYDEATYEAEDDRKERYLSQQHGSEDERDETYLSEQHGSEDERSDRYLSEQRGGGRYSGGCDCGDGASGGKFVFN